MASKRRKTNEGGGPPAPPAVVIRHPPETDQSKELVDLFNKMQTDEMSTAKAVRKMKKIFENSDRDNFFKHLVFMLQIPLVNGSSKERPNKFDEKILQVVARFAAGSLEDEAEKSMSLNDSGSSTIIDLPWILRKTFNWLLDHHGVQSSCARLRICMMINWLLKNLGLHAEIDEVLYQKIHDNMMERLQDKVAEIRAQAVTALQRLQDPMDSNCPIICGYLRHLKCDPSALVRRTILTCIGASRATLKHILERTCDVDDTVRKAAFHLIAEKVSMKIFSIAEREELLRQGLNDRNASVQKVVEKELVPAWLRNCNGNIIELLHAIDVGNSDGKTAADICKAIFNDVPYDQLFDSFKYLDPATRMVPLKKLTPETITYWKNLVAYFDDQTEKGNAEDAQNHLEKLLPELTRFCNYVRDYIANHMGKVPPSDDGQEPDEEEIEAYEVAGAFVTKELIELSAYFDMVDEVGRQNLCRLCKELLANRRLHAGFVEPIMKIYNSIQKNPETRIQEIAEIISDLRDPLLSSQQLQQVQAQQCEQQQQQQQQLEEQRQKEAEEMNKSLEEMNEKERQEEKKRAEAEAKRNEEALRKKRVQLAKLRFRMNIVKDEMDTAVQKQEFVLAQEKKIEYETVSEEAKILLAEIEQATAVQLTPKEPERVRPVVERPPPPPPDSPILSQLSQPLTQTQRDDPVMVLKSLTMLSELMRSSDIVELNATLQTLLDEFIASFVRDLSYEIREAAVRAMGCACLRSIKAAKKHLLIILSMAHLDVPIVRCRALRVVVDLLMWHGLSAFISASDNQTDDEEDEDEMSTFSFDNNRQTCILTQADLNSQGGDSVVTVLCQLLDDPDADIRTLVAEGLCKLILCGTIVSHRLITRLILMWCNPVNEANTRMKTVLGMFFPLYASLSRANQETLEESFMGTMKTLIDAPETSPLAMVNLEDIGLFYIQLTRPAQIQESCRPVTEDSNVHDSLALTISNYIISTPDSFYLKSFAKFLINLQISTANYQQLRKLRDLQNQIINKIPDNLVSKTIEKFRIRLEQFIAQDPELSQNTEPQQEMEIADRRGSLGPDCLSIVNAAEVTTALGMTAAKKRTLFSDTQNTMLEMSFAASPAGTIRKKGRFVSSTESNLTSFMPQMFSTQASSTLRPASTSSLMECTQKRSRHDEEGEEDSDPEIEFKRPEKILRTATPSVPKQLGASFIEDKNEEFVSGNLYQHSKKNGKEKEAQPEPELTAPTPEQKNTESGEKQAEPEYEKPDSTTKQPISLDEQLGPADVAVSVEPEKPKNLKTRSAKKSKVVRSKPADPAHQRAPSISSVSSSDSNRGNLVKASQMNLSTSSEDDFIIPPPKRPNRGKSRRETLIDVMDSPLMSGTQMTMTSKRRKRLDSSRSSASSQPSTRMSSQSSTQSQSSQSSATRRSSRSLQSLEAAEVETVKKAKNTGNSEAADSGRRRRSLDTNPSSSEATNPESGRPKREIQPSRKARESMESANTGKTLAAQKSSRTPQPSQDNDRVTTVRTSARRVQRLLPSDADKDTAPSSEGRVKRRLIESRLSDEIEKFVQDDKKAKSKKDDKKTNSQKVDKNIGNQTNESGGRRPRRSLIDRESAFGSAQRKK